MKKRILFMVQVPPPVHGAGLRNQSLLQSRLLNEKLDIKLLPLSFANSIATIGKPSIKKMVKTFTYAIKLWLCLIRFRPNIAYFTLTPAGGAFYRDCIFVLILKVMNVQILYHLRGIGIKKAKQKNRINHILYNFVFKNTNVVCLSSSQIEDIEGLRYKRHFVVPNGISIESDYKPLTHTGNDKIKLLFLSNFIRTKGVYDFLDSLNTLRKLNRKFQATIVGADYDITKKDIEDYISQHQLSDCVYVSGPLFGKEKFKVIEQCDIFVFPTYYPFELFPGVILEAMQCSKPVISTNHAAIPDIIEEGKTGFLVDIKCPDQIAEKIIFLSDRPDEIVRLGTNAGDCFYKKYTLERFEQNMLDVFNAV